MAFEEGTQAQWLHDLLAPHAERVVVCNVRGKNEVVNKSDRIDTGQLSELLRLGSLKAVYHGSPGVGTLKQLARCYINLVEDSTRVILRVKAIYRGPGPIGTSGEAVYRPSQRASWLAKLEGWGARARAGSLLTQLGSWVGWVGGQVASSLLSHRRRPCGISQLTNCRDAAKWGSDPPLLIGCSRR